MSDRITELEIKFAFSEDLLDELNRTVARQQQQIADLERHLRELRLQIQRSMPADPAMPAHEIPPH
ncbi:MAG: SlyX family protein, partial [Betaproteobacteria bacterium]|nr:SlyX family protein [Betaproteobacteria bacterium]